MKANELMIGDWVRYPNPFRIEQIDGVEEQVYGDDGFWVDTRDLRPIPLTYDILNKNFPDTEDGVFWCWDDRKEEENWFEIRIEKDDVDFRMDMRYVHEFHHALRLCGIEKTIEL